MNTKQVIEAYGEDGVYYTHNDIPFWRVEGSNNQGGNCSFAAKYSLEEAKRDLELKKAHPEHGTKYTTWFITKYQPMVAMTIEES